MNLFALKSKQIITARNHHGKIVAIGIRRLGDGSGAIFEIIVPL